MDTPYLEVNLDAIRSNARRLKVMSEASGVEITFVTKGFCALTEIVEAVHDCGIQSFADSRMRNIIKVKKRFPDVSYLLIRTPKLSEVAELVEWADYSLQSQIEVIRAVSEEAVRRGKVHKIILMIDVGDLREGIFGEEQLLEIAPQIKVCQGVELVGVATNVGCYGSIMPSVENTSMLVKYRDILNRRFGFHISLISGGATCTTLLMEQGRLPEGVNGLRIGEAILFGEDTTNNRTIEGFRTDAFTLGAEIVELKRKPSMPIGERGRDCCGNITEYEDRGVRWRAICAVGKQDVKYDAMTPLLPGAEVLGSSSDHLIVDVENCRDEVAVGTVLRFRCGYMAVLTATTSAYVDVIFNH
ncbi:MAG: alanine/ornithine racemase family PLP-dependent enzyme [Clostridia bacterium]|nr:alanine/ornithine racemase family PLP-dependent enzyme [Clostridia bacterium]